VTIDVKVFPPFQPKINSNKMFINYTTCRPTHKLSYATRSYLVAIE